MLSDSSSTSVKRSLSSDAPSQDPDTDAYMADLAIDTVRLVPPYAAMHQSVPPAEKIARVEAAKAGRLNPGDTWYLIDRTWWKRWKKACTGVVDKEGPVTEEQLGGVDNSALVDGNGYLRAPLSDTVDYELVPEAAWNDLVSWCVLLRFPYSISFPFRYGEPKHPLPRKVITRGEQKEATVELYPLRVTVMRMVTHPPQSTESTPSISISCAETVADFNKALAHRVRPHALSENTPFRIWKVNAPPSTGFDSDEFAVDDFSTYECENIEGTAKSLEETGLQQGDAFVVEFKTLGAWFVDAPLASRPPPLETAATIIPAPPLFASGTGFFDKFGGGSSSPRSFGSSLTRSAASTSKTLEPGTLGLGNMGNTCFMNSALQCLAHEPELVDYFLTGVFTTELNPDNPLGMHGAIAQAFGALLSRIWAASGSSTSYAPREFKTQLQRFAPQFSGYQQHDSQELVAFLLDGLHEDLNRVIKKPYVEKPDWEGGGDEALVQLAQKSWDGYMLRNDSVIVDLFQGQYQSTLVCPECQKVSYVRLERWANG
jgi:ubiquitin carboxyl-terminal hydrolase 4/11/15